MPTRITLWVSLVAVVAMASLAGAQQDTRVQSGNVLDANPQVGSGGVNPSAQPYSPINSQLYVTGQVTGLAGFRGDVGYFGTDQLHLTLPGASVRAFEQRSVGAYQAVHGAPTYRTQGYLDRAQTVLSVRGISSGATATGTNIPLHSTLSTSVANELYGTVTRPYRTLYETPGVTSTAMPSIGRETLAPVWVRSSADQTPDRYAGVDRPGATALFGLPWLDEREQLVQELRQRAQADELEDEDVRIGERMDTRIDTEGFSLDPLPVTGGEDEETISLRGLPRPGDDAFHDLLMALRHQQIAAAGEDAEPVEAEDGQTDDLIAISFLGGEHRDYFNEFMTEGDELLRAGQYYDAADKYRGAITINPQNPMARLGAALALFGAGESYSAAMYLRSAMRLFPPLIETRLDIAAMMDVNTFDDRLDEFKRQIRERPELPERPGPLLLATYLHNSIGQRVEARRYALRLRAVAHGDEIYQAYAQFVLTGQRPDGDSD